MEVGARISAAANKLDIAYSGSNTPSKQVLVYHDLLGMMQHPHHAKVTPKFCKQYGNVGVEIEKSLSAFNQEVKSRAFPSPAFSPYKIPGQLQYSGQ